MADREKVMWSLARCSCGVPDACSDCHYDNYPPRICVQHLTSDALALLKAQEPRVMTLKEIQKYLDEPDGDKVPLWLEWHSIPQLSGWVLASPVKDLMIRHIDGYNITWRPWTSRPTDVQREAEKWDE